MLNARKRPGIEQYMGKEGLEGRTELGIITDRSVLLSSLWFLCSLYSKPEPLEVSQIHAGSCWHFAAPAGATLKAGSALTPDKGLRQLLCWFCQLSHILAGD